MRLLYAVLTCGVALGFSSAAQEAEETPRDSIKVIVTGCLEDRVLQASDVETPEHEKAPPIIHETFRLSGKKAMMAEVKRLEGRRLAVTGYVRKFDLQEPGMKVKGGRVIIGAPSSDPRRPPLPDTRERLVVLEVVGLEELSGTCP